MDDRDAAAEAADPRGDGERQGTGEPREREYRLPGAARLGEGQVRKVLLSREDGRAPIEVALCRLEGRLHAVDSLCPHEGGRLAAGELVGGRYLSCPLHLYKFDPRDGRAVDVPCEPARVHAVREEGSDAIVTVRAERRSPGDASPAP